MLLLQAVGLVWEKCEPISEGRLPRGNHDAGHQILAKQRGLLKDALEELEEAWQASQDDVDDDEDFGTWEEDEKELVPPTIGLLKAALNLGKKAGQALKQKGSSTNAKEVQEVDQFVMVCERLSPAADDLAMAAYPPVDRNALEARAKDLVAACKDALAKLDGVHFVKDTKFEDWGPFLGKALDHNITKLIEVIARHQMSKASVK